MKQEALNLRGVCIENHRFGAIRDATFSIYRDEAVLLTGLFNSGLVTLVHLLAGELGAFGGEMRINKKSCSVLRHDAAHEQGIAVIGLRHLLSDNMNYFDNIRMLSGNGRRLGFMPPPKYSEDVLALFELMQLDWNVAAHTPFERIKWDIFAAYFTGAEIMVFSDMEAYCNNEEFDELEQVLCFLKTHGISLLLVAINDNLWRYTEIADRCLVMRKGILTTVLEKGEDGLFDDDAIRHVVVGRRFPPRFLKSSAPQLRERGAPLALILRLCGTGEEIAFRPGEAIGLYDSDSRLPATPEAFIGMAHGAIQFLSDGKPFSVKTLQDLAARGIAVILNASVDKMIFKNLPPAENVAFFAQKRVANQLYSAQISRYIFENVVQRYSILKHCAALKDRPDCHGLSYQELFELMVGKWLAANPSVVVLFTSLSNEDIKQTERFRDLQQELLEMGKAVLLLSSDYDRLECDCEEIYEI